MYSRHISCQNQSANKNQEIQTETLPCVSHSAHGGGVEKGGWSVVCGIGLPAMTRRDARQTVYKSQSDPSLRRAQHTN